MTLSGTARKSLPNGKRMKLYRRVGAGEWIKVGGARIGGGSFSASGIATGQETNSWQAVAKVKKGRKGHKRKKTYISGVVSHAMYSWYPLTMSTDVGDGDFYDDRVDIGAETFTSAIYAADRYEYDTFEAEWNMSYKCLLLNAVYGLDNDSATGSTTGLGGTGRCRIAVGD